MILRPLLSLLLVLGNAGTQAQDICVVPRTQQGSEQLAYQGPNHWFVSEDRSLFEIRADKLVSTITHDGPRLHLACGKDNEVLAFTTDKVFRAEKGGLHLMPTKFPGKLAHTDGKLFYSFEMQSIGVFSLFATRDGKTRQLAKGEVSFLTLEGHFVVFDKNGYTVFQDGNAIVRGKKPQKSRGITSFEAGGLMSCNHSHDGIFPEGLDLFYTVRTAQGDTSITTPGYISLGASRQQCSEYVLLLGDNEHPERANTLWSLIPREGQPLKPLPTPCRVDAFVLNEDGSLHYRCGNTLYFKDALRRHDVTVGKLPFGAVVSDRWLVVPGYGTLYAAIFDSAIPSHRVCFSRLIGEKMIQIGCAQITPEPPPGLTHSNLIPPSPHAEQFVYVQ